MFEDAPNPILAEKILIALYILAKGQPNTPVRTEDALVLIEGMSLEELRRTAAEIRRRKHEKK